MGFLNKLTKIFGKEEAHNTEDALQGKILKSNFYEIDEEDKLVVALAATIMAGKDKNNSYYHISKITRIE